MEQKNCEIFIDGASHNEINQYGYAIIICKDKKVIDKKYGRLSKNADKNKAELESLLQALMYIDKHDGLFKIYSDCEVIVKSLTGECKRQNNRTYWDLIEPLCDKNVGRVSIENVESHQKNNVSYIAKYNNMADKLANKGANSLLIAPIERK